LTSAAIALLERENNDADIIAATLNFMFRS
jgi:hypothetical protein